MRGFVSSSISCCDGAGEGGRTEEGGGHEHDVGGEEVGAAEDDHDEALLIHIFQLAGRHFDDFFL